MAGTYDRFMLKSMLKHLIKPIAAQIELDFYGSFTTAKAKAYRSEQIYPEYFHPDPILPREDDPDKIKQFIETKFFRFSSNASVQKLII